MAVNIVKLRNLINLAVSPSASEGEIRNASVAAIKIINEHNLLDVLEKHISVHQNQKTVNNYTNTHNNYIERIYKTKSGVEIKLSTAFNYIHNDHYLASRIIECVLKGMRQLKNHLGYTYYGQHALVSVPEILYAVKSILTISNTQKLETNIRFLLADLVKTGVLRGKKGRNGGYYLV